MKKVLLLLLMFGAVLFLLFGWIEGKLFSLYPGSRLDFFESRIASVESEFMRRVPKLRENFKGFDTCIHRLDCDITPILVERDDLIKKNWEALSLRLMVKNDWGTKNFTSIAHQKFLKDVATAGGPKKIVSCKLLIRYYLLSNAMTAYIYEGLRCPEIPRRN